MGETPVRLPPRRVGLTVGGEACHRDASGRLEDIHNIDGVVATSISALFLRVISIANLFFLNGCGSPDRYRRSEDTLHRNRDCGHKLFELAGTRSALQSTDLIATGATPAPILCMTRSAGSTPF